MTPAPLLATLAMVAALGQAGCSNKQPEGRAEPVAGPAAPAEARAAEVPAAAPSAPPAPARPVAAAAMPVDFSPDCVAYAALIDKLRTCDKAAGARDGLTRSYEDLRVAWTMVPADQRAAVSVQCKAQADSLRNAAAATCGW